jgi:hypothetical protein
MASNLFCLIWFIARTRTGTFNANESPGDIDMISGVFILIAGIVAIATAIVLVCKKGAGVIRWWQWVYLSTASVYVARFLWSFVLIVF